MEDVVIKILPDFTIWKLHSFKEILIFFPRTCYGPCCVPLEMAPDEKSPHTGNGHEACQKSHQRRFP